VFGYLEISKTSVRILKKNHYVESSTILCCF